MILLIFHAVGRGDWWNDEDQRHAWYHATQGSRLIPEAWYLALKDASSDNLFFSIENLESFGFTRATGTHATKMPIGFAIDSQDDSKFEKTKLRWYQSQGSDSENWVGLTCAACHTGQITVRGKTTIIEGGASLIDFQNFIERFDESLDATLNDNERFKKFSKAVLKGKPQDPTNEALLRTALTSLVDWQKKTSQINKTDLRYGFGRVDAFGHIYNKIILFSRFSPRPPGEIVSPAPIVNPADAPVSFPFLWNIHKQQRVQWNGIAENSTLGKVAYGALGRNVGEVLGVFGEVMIRKPENKADAIGNGLVSSAIIKNLIRLESMVEKLRPPKWSNIVGSVKPIVSELRDEGEKHYKKFCIGCHLLPESNKPTEKMIKFSDTLKNNRTDIWMACNAVIYQTQSEILEGVGQNFSGGEPIAEESSIATMLSATVKGVLLANKGQVLAEASNTFLGLDRIPIVIPPIASPADRKVARRKACESAVGQVELLAYKARPLDGIWATAPYLHNGSVPTLYHLLTPKERPETFWVGTTDYELENVGYYWKEARGKRNFKFDTRLEGNSNRGHEYGSKGLEPHEKMELIEYLKTL